MTTLLAAFLDIAADWRCVFPQSRTFQRAVRQALGSLVCLGRRCLSRIIWTNGGQHRSWSAEPLTASPVADSAATSRPPEVSSAAFRARPPDLRFALLMDMDFAVRCPLVRRSRLESGSCTSARAFAPRFFQTLRRRNALALR